MYISFKYNVKDILLKRGVKELKECTYFRHITWVREQVRAVVRASQSCRVICYTHIIILIMHSIAFHPHAVHSMHVFKKMYAY